MTARTPSELTDNPDELFDLVDLDDRVIGVVRRGDAHRNPALIHRSVQALIFSTDGRLLLQKRSARKDLFPGYYCASASGHVDAGEDYATTATREIREELGVELRVVPFAKTLVRSACETEITAMFVGECDGPFTFHLGETDGGEFMSLGAIRQRRDAGTLPMTPALLAALDELERRGAASALPRLLAGL
ncbi:MAG TPA: NUDIX domain-containing protein [Ktedonobacterales bacterium]|nr:NUDIX domain-containing protein [Ktedonobacterales bacterium]